ncbi:MAG TPA: DNA polymerase IV, partial [Pseudonocardia sp.]|nr:DNA polymerase IV [Pseudonocardia sp.]
VKARNADFTTASRSETTAYASTDLGALTAVAQRLAQAAVPEGGVRLVGVSLSGLGDTPPPTLFEAFPTFESPPVSEPDEAGDVPVTVDEPEVAPGGRHAPADPDAPWRAGDDVAHPEHGHGWVQGGGHGRVTVRFETRATGPGPARTFASDDPALSRADPHASWRTD